LGLELLRLGDLGLVRFDHAGGEVLARLDQGAQRAQLRHDLVVTLAALRGEPETAPRERFDAENLALGIDVHVTTASPVRRRGADNSTVLYTRGFNGRFTETAARKETRHAKPRCRDRECGFVNPNEFPTHARGALRDINPNVIAPSPGAFQSTRGAHCLP